MIIKKYHIIIAEGKGGKKITGDKLGRGVGGRG